MSEQWQDERRKRLTASRVGSIAKMRAKTKRNKKVNELLYSTFWGNEATRYGTEMEEKTRQEYTTHQQEMGHQGLAVDSAGLSVSLENPWLAASPDGLVNDPNDGPHPSGLVEVKTPHSIRNKPLSEACTMPSFCLEKEENDGSLCTDLNEDMTTNTVPAILYREAVV